jgi:hypothetical protein
VRLSDWFHQLTTTFQIPSVKHKPTNQLVSPIILSTQTLPCKFMHYPQTNKNKLQVQIVQLTMLYMGSDTDITSSYEDAYYIPIHSRLVTW